MCWWFNSLHKCMVERWITICALYISLALFVLGTHCIHLGSLGIVVSPWGKDWGKGLLQTYLCAFWDRKSHHVFVYVYATFSGFGWRGRVEGLIEPIKVFSWLKNFCRSCCFVEVPYTVGITEKSWFSKSICVVQLEQLSHCAPFRNVKTSAF